MRLIEGRRSGILCLAMPTQKPITVLELLGRSYRVFRWVLLAACVIVFFLILHPDTPPEVQVDAKALASLQSKVASMHQPAARPSRELRLNEAELNGWLRSNLAIASASPPPGSGPKVTEDPPRPSGAHNMTVEEVQSNVRDVRVTLHGDRIHGYVLFELYGKNLSLTLNGSLELRDGYLRLAPTAMKLGSMPIPRATLERAVQQLFDSPENRAQFRVPSRIRDIRVENSTLIIAY
jgi:hypothetical protein